MTPTREWFPFASRRAAASAYTDGVVAVRACFALRAFLVTSLALALAACSGPSDGSGAGGTSGLGGSGSGGSPGSGGSGSGGSGSGGSGIGRFGLGRFGFGRRLQHRRFGLRGPFRRWRHGFGGRLGHRRFWRCRWRGGTRRSGRLRRRARQRRLERDGWSGRERRHDGDRRRRRARAVPPAGPSMSRRPATTRTRAPWRSRCGPWARRATSCAA